MDESGSRASSSRFFVLGAVKVRHSGQLARALRSVRDKTGFNHEFKFAEITNGALPAYYAAVDALLESDAHLAACVVNRDVHDPFGRGKEALQVHLDVASQLLCGCINRRELVTVCLDGISTPADVAFDDRPRDRVNRRFNDTSIVAAMCLDSRTRDGLQMADLVAGAIAYDRRQRASAHGPRSSVSSPKAKVALRLASGLGVPSFEDLRDGRINIATYRVRPRPRPGNVVKLHPKEDSA